MLSRLLHSKQVSTVDMFVQVWKTDIQPHSSGTPLSNNTMPPLTTGSSSSSRPNTITPSRIQPHSSGTPLSNNTTTPLTTGSSSSSHPNTITPSRKRTAADAQLHQHSSTPPALRPVHIVSGTPQTEDDSASLQLDEAIEKGFVGNGQ